MIFTDVAILPQASVYLAVQDWVYEHPDFTGPLVITIGVNAPSQLSIPVKTGTTIVGLHPDKTPL